MSAESKEEISSLFDLDYHETADVNADTKVLRVPNGWIYHFNLTGKACSSVFVPEFIPMPPAEENNSEDAALDAEICDVLNDVLRKDLTVDTIQVNRIIRQLQKRNQSSE